MDERGKEARGYEGRLLPLRRGDVLSGKAEQSLVARERDGVATD